MSTDVDGPLPPSERASLPDDWMSHVPPTTDYKVDQVRRALRLYLAGHSCAECQVKTGVNAESLREVLAKMDLTRSRGEALRLKHIQKKRRARDLFEQPRRRENATVARLVGADPKVVGTWRRLWKKDIPVHDWSCKRAV
jgi:hypothetical protein